MAMHTGEKQSRWDGARLLSQFLSAVQGVRCGGALAVAVCATFIAVADAGQARTLAIVDKGMTDGSAFARNAAWIATRDLVPWFPAMAGLMSMQRRGGKSICVLTISADVQGYVASTAATGAGYDITKALTVILTVNSGIYAGASTRMDGFATGSSLRLANLGYIVGSGGNGNGFTGGDALILGGNNVTIDNGNGYIFGGGGGGGNGGASAQGQVNACQGGGGGGGYGDPGGTGGGPNGSGNAGTSGGSGSRIGGGGGGNGGHDDFYGNSGGGGGAGGYIATTGTSGSWASTGEPPGGGGAPGKAVQLNGVSITWESGYDATHVKGAVS